MRRPRLSPRRRASVIVALASALLVALATVTSAGTTAPAAAADTRGSVVGTITQSGGQVYNGWVKVTLFTNDWQVVHSANVRSVYEFRVPAGDYRIQVTDTRPVYDINRFGPSDRTTRVYTGRTVRKDVGMGRGASITGTARTNGSAAANARVVAANNYGQSFETKANGAGQFAIGGLPAGNYSVYTWDARGQWSGPSTWLPRRWAGTNANISINLTQRSGALFVRFYERTNRLWGTSGWATARSKATGQWYTARITNGAATFAGVHPGAYELTVPTLGSQFGRTGSLPGNRQVPRGGLLETYFQLNERGASVTGTIVDSKAGARTLAGVRVRLYSTWGNKLGETRTASNGTFTIAGAIRDQPAARLVIDADATGGWLKTGSGSNDQCQYAATKSIPFSMSTGRISNLGSVGLTVVGSTQNPYCFPQQPTPTSPTTPASPTTPPSSPATPTTPPTSPSPSATTSPATPAPTSTATATATSTATATAAP
ncbi:hypothetical protein RDV89_14065 [Nocardioides zeae]|uniref:Alpha-amylase n=1 Tax=Nocardioides imazamoxiresistens TaxID=3231893 RepID=A0ABU3PYA5_9ACTN|nr:hypothetical protein [Nocardioides zeae]MDT9594204.1 hypothetical protein [Nocardioides zeae]